MQTFPQPYISDTVINIKQRVLDLQVRGNDLDLSKLSDNFFFMCIQIDSFEDITNED